MNKILLALTILSGGAAGFLASHQSRTQILSEANATRAAWQGETQLVAAAQNTQANLIERVRDLKQTLTQRQDVGESVLWSALQTNRAGRLPPELREHLLEELGFNWQSLEEFILVSKDTLGDIGMPAIRGGKLTDLAATVLAVTPGERGRIEAEMERVQARFKDWASSHIERSEPKDDVVAQYALPGDPSMSISNDFAAGVSEALGRERAELILPSAGSWMYSMGIAEKPRTMILKRYLAGNEERLKFQLRYPNGGGDSDELWQGPKRGFAQFPEPFRPAFPNGWADVAKREGFELPKESQEK